MSLVPTELLAGSSLEKRMEIPKIVNDALKKLEEKAKEHNNRSIDFASYCPFGDVSAATLVHREALRVCACVGRGDDEGAYEHLVDTVVFAILMSERRKK